jgi:branched-subunit amino acid ABC-type transport system permease component
LKRWKQQVAAFALTVLASWGIYALLGLGIVLVYRTSRILNIAGGEIAMFIGYVGALAVADGLPFLIAVALAAAAAMALGLAIFWLAIRRVMGEPPHVGLILTVGIGTILNGFMIVLFGGGMVAIPTALPAFTTIGSLRLPTPDVVAAVGAWLCIATIALVYGLTNLGLQMRAVAERVMLSAQRGLNVDRTVALSLDARNARNWARRHSAWRARLDCIIGIGHRRQRSHCLSDRRHGQHQGRGVGSADRCSDRELHRALS